MMGAAVDILSFVLIVAGGFFIVTGAVGILRMPDVYTRMHAASLIDTLGATLLIAGLALQADSMIVVMKLVVVLALLFFIGPVASHALAQAALEAGVRPVLDEDRRERSVASGEAGASADSRGTGARPT